MEAKKRKIEISLTRDRHLQSQMETLVGGRGNPKSTRKNIDEKEVKIFWKSQPETSGESLGHTFGCHTPLRSSNQNFVISDIQF
jgi:hypothetical protein